MIKLSVIIVNYNVRDFLEQALYSIQRALENISSEVYVVDNASSDGSTKIVRERFPDVQIIENNNNVGFARANNMAIERASGQYIALINPDTLVKEDTFESILHGFEEFPEAGMIGCKVLNPDGTLQLSCRRSFPTPWIAMTRMTGLSYLFPKNRIFGRYNLTYLNEDSIEEVDAISGSFMTVSRKVIDSVGGLDEDFFMYGEDLEWCYKIKEAGWKILYYPKTSIIHYKGESSRQSSMNQLKLFYDAMAIFSEKHFRSYNILTPLWLLKISIWMRALFTFMLRSVQSLAIPLVDSAFVFSSILLAFYIRFGALIKLPLYGDYRDFLIIGGMSSGLILISLFIQGVYPRNRFSIRRGFRGALWGSIAAAMFIFFSRWLAVSRLVIILSALLQVFFITGWRILLRLVIRNISGNKLFLISDEMRPVRSIIVGADPVSRKIFNKFKKHPYYSSQIVGMVSLNPEESDQSDQSKEIIGDFSELFSIIKKYRITDIIFSAASHSYDRIIDTITLCHEARVGLKLVPTSLELIIGKSSILPIGELPLIDIEYKYFEGKNRALKRLIDITISGILIVIAFPAYFTTKVFKQLSSQSRLVLGEKGVPVYVKQIVKNREPYSGWARLFPLWIHVIKGELSFVGAPLIFDSQEINKKTSLMKPGIFSYEYIKPELDAMFNGSTFELTYLKNYTIFYDLKIIYNAVFKKIQAK
ncbi:glycosyltransferase [candidate division KSB1 bacterium]